MSIYPGPTHGTSVSDLDVADYIKLPGIWTFATLPKGLPSRQTGLTAYTSDAGQCVYNGTVWVQGGTSGSSPTFQNLILTGYLYESFTDNVTAHAGGGQALATQLTTEMTRVTTVATAGDSIKLPPSQAGLTLFVTNHGANAMQVYGSGTDTIDDVAAATGVSQMANSEVIFCCFTAGQWYCNGLASGFVRGQSLQTFSSAVIAAAAGGTQAAGTPINQMLVNVTATAAGQSSTLPPSAPGVEITVHNISAYSTLVFPNAGGTGTETINSLAANAALSMAAGTSTVFTCTTAGQWYTVPRVPS